MQGSGRTGIKKPSGGKDKCAKLFAKWETKCNKHRSDNMTDSQKKSFENCKASAAAAYKAAGC